MINNDNITEEISPMAVDLKKKVLAEQEKIWMKSDVEKEVWVEKDSFRTNFIWVKYADEGTKRELKECRKASLFSVKGDHLYYVKDSYFFRIHMKTLAVEFLEENIRTFKIYKDIAIVIKYEKQEGSIETRAVVLKISLTDLKKEFVKIAKEHRNAVEGRFPIYSIDRVPKAKM